MQCAAGRAIDHRRDVCAQYRRGLTFSAPHRINDDGLTTKWHWFGTFSVAPNGRLDTVWHDSRNAANNTDSQLFYSYSTDAGVTWSPNVAVSNPFNPFEGYPNQNKIGDYITMVSDSTGANVAYSATFNFNPNRGQHEEDVYYVRVFPSGGGTPTPTPTASPTATPTATASSTATATATLRRQTRRQQRQPLHRLLLLRLHQLPRPRYSYSHSYGYINGHSQADADAEIWANAEAAPHAASATVVVQAVARHR